MSFNTNTGRAEYTASTGQTVFPFVFKIFNNTDIKVYKTPIGNDPDDTEDLLILTTNYTITIDDDAGGQITLIAAASNGDAITLLRDLPITREVEYQTSGDLLAKTLNDDQEYQTYLLADNKGVSDRTLIFPENLQGMDNILPNPEALKLLRWDSSETKIENTTIGDDTVFINVYIVDTIADLILADPDIYSTINVRGYHSVNDGGGGIFNYDASQSAVNNGGTIINGWVRQFSGAINVKWFGAKGDGTTDDSDAFLSADPVLVVPLGVYKIDSTSSFSGKLFILENGAELITTNESIRIQSANNEPDRLFSKKGNSMELIAHRGFRNHYPENTMLAMTSAYNNGADSLECDVQVSSDGELVIFHDSTVDALTDGTGAVSALTLAYLQSLTFDTTAGTIYSEERIPTFEEVLEFAKSKGVYLYSEIKGYRSQADIDLMIQAVIDAGMEDLTMFQSFTLSDLEYVRTKNSKIAIGQLGSGTTGLEAKVDYLETLGSGALLWSYSSLASYPSIVEYAYDRDVDIGCWTVNTDINAKSMMDIGVNKIMSDIRLGGSKW